MTRLTDALRKAIDESGLTLYRIAKDAGLDYSIISRFYHGEREMQLSSADKLAEYFDLELRSKAKRKAAK